jgi:hypothetical protein
VHTYELVRCLCVDRKHRSPITSLQPHDGTQPNSQRHNPNIHACSRPDTQTIHSPVKEVTNVTTACGANRCGGEILVNTNQSINQSKYQFKTTTLPVHQSNHNHLHPRSDPSGEPQPIAEPPPDAIHTCSIQGISKGLSELLANSPPLFKTTSTNTTATRLEQLVHKKNE